MARRRRPLVPESRAALDQLKSQVMGGVRSEDAKFEAAKEVGVPLQKGYNGMLTSVENGKVGGRIGGSMVKELVRMAQEEMKKKQ